MPLTAKEKAIAGFAWSCGNLGQTLQEMEIMLETASVLGGFDPDIIQRASIGDCPTEGEILERLKKNIKAS